MLQFPSTDGTKFARLQRMGIAELKALLGGPAEIAAEWIAEAARHGVIEAQMRLGRMLLDGTGVTQDQKQALGWFMTAARRHDADAMNMVGRCYENGWGVAADPTEAARWYANAAARHHAWAQYNLGHLYLDGIGVARDAARAVALYRAAADQGHPRAMNLLGRCCEHGWGVPVSASEAAFWYQRSAEGGYFRGQYNYATILAEAGQIDKAINWFEAAARTGTEPVAEAARRWLARLQTATEYRPARGSKPTSCRI